MVAQLELPPPDSAMHTAEEHPQPNDQEAHFAQFYPAILATQELEATEVTDQKR